MDINVNLLNNYVFVIKYLASFVKYIKDNICKDVNKGSQSLRGVTNSMHCLAFWIKILVIAYIDIILNLQKM